jgi:hypothetical protein
MGVFRYLFEFTRSLPSRVWVAWLRECERFDAYDREHNPRRADT